MYRLSKYVVLACVIGCVSPSYAEYYFSLGGALGTDVGIFALGSSKLDKGLAARPGIGYEYFLDVGFSEKTSIEITLLSSSGFSASDDYMDKLNDRKTAEIMPPMQAFYSGMKYWADMHGVSLKHHFWSYGDSKIFLLGGLGLYKIRMESDYGQGTIADDIDKIRISAESSRTIGINIAAIYETPVTDFLGLELFTRFNVFRGELSGYNPQTRTTDKFLEKSFLPFFEFKARLIYHNVYF